MIHYIDIFYVIVYGQAINLLFLNIWGSSDLVLLDCKRLKRMKAKDLKVPQGLEEG